jgi:two-component system response regulator AtoC
MKNQKLILIVDDESSMRKNMADLLESEGYNYIEAADGEEALSKVKINLPDLVLLDINLPKLDGLSVLREIVKLFPPIPVIIFTAYGTSDRAIDTMKLGAFDYLEKPFELDEFLITIKRALKHSELIGEVRQLREQVESISTNSASDQIIGRSASMQKIFKMIGKVAVSDATILVQGDSGTGKELIADAIQRHSIRRDKPYIKVNCGALTESILESEIFGHEKGSFTGATSQRLGRFELANGGTIFLDEINNMPLALQVKLLRILQKQSFYRVGGETPITVDVRVIAASNINIEDAVKNGQLRKDLFYRLNVVRIDLPPLVERKEDIPYLVEHFSQKHSGGRRIAVSESTMNKLLKYNWPGNVRELENTIQRALVVSNRDLLSIDNLPSIIMESEIEDSLNHFEDWFSEIKSQNKSLKDVISGIEKDLIIKALSNTEWNRSKAAKLLKMHRRLLYTKMKEYNIQLEKK